MNRSRSAAIAAFAVLLLAAGCKGRRAAGDTASGAVVDRTTTEAAAPEPTGAGEATPFEKASSPQMTTAPVRTWIGPDGSRKRWGPFVENDTTFLFVHEYPLGSDTNRYKVFIRKGPQPDSSPNFTDLSPRNATQWKDFTAQLRTIKKRHPEPLRRHSALKEVSGGWTPVRIFRGNCYVDCFNPYPVWISDSLFIRESMDGPSPSPIDTAQRIAPTHYRLRTTGRDGNDRVDIHIVDTVRTIAVFTFGNEENPLRAQSLYVPFETGRAMDRIDFYSLELPEDEVEWDDIDFEALISGAAALPDSNPKTAQNNNQ